jgi:hypothetical protein
MMRRFLFALTVVLLVFSSCAHAQEDIDIPQSIRAHNRNDHGVCWFCAAQMAGAKAGIVPMLTLVDDVVKSGVGFHTGATESSVQHHLTRMGVKALSNMEGDTSQAAVRRIQSWLDKGFPVVISIRQGTGTHAVLVTRIGKKQESWKDDKDNPVTDYPVDVIDPNTAKLKSRYPWSWFTQVWTGRAFAFDPNMQDSKLVRGYSPPPTPQVRKEEPVPVDENRLPGRLMANGVFYPLRVKKVDEQVLQRVKETITRPPIEVRYQAKPYQPHELPFVTDHSFNPTPVKFPSNQDINDGVTRPSDVFYLPTYGGATGYDYNAEYKAYRANKEGGK